MVKPEQTPANGERLLLHLVRKELPAARVRAIMAKPTTASHGDEPTISANRRVAHGPVRRDILLRDLRGDQSLWMSTFRKDVYLNMLPYVGFRINHAHVGLICSSVDEHPVVHLQEGISSVVLHEAKRRYAELVENVTYWRVLTRNRAF